MTLRRLSAAISALSLMGAAAVSLGTTASAVPSLTAGTHTTKKLVRAHLIGGKTKVVDTRDFSLSVGSTAGLRNRQELTVGWTGAHPTGGVAVDPNSADAQFEEYPVVLLECRGTQRTVDPTTCWTQTARERFQRSSFAYPSWRLDRFANQAGRAAVVGQPKKRPAVCGPPSTAEHWVPFRAQNGDTFYGGPGLLGCAGLPPEASNGDTQIVPSNETFGVTDPDGTGEASFDVWTAEQNASLGCSPTVDCSLVVVPIMGISCDEKHSQVPARDRPDAADLAKADDLCTASGQFKPGQVASQSVGTDVAVSGSLWWAASNWRNRIVVPLHFAPLSTVCDVVNGKVKKTLQIYGSELMTQATTQWAPTFCLNKPFSVQHVQTGEPQAANLLRQGTIEAALVSNPPPGGYGKPAVNAPVAVTGFAIAADVDRSDGKPASVVKLTPRLIAKLLTESYPAVSGVQQEDADLAGNPLNITDDPEFRALNPGVPESGQVTAATLLGLSSDSDVIHALTSYIEADPAARSWLDGKPDQWGMRVNPAYKGMTLPVDNWPLLDTFEPDGIYQPGINDCLYDDPVPYLPLVASPMLRLSLIAQAMQFAVGNSQINCVRPNAGVSAGEKLTSVGRETPGHRFMLGITSLADARRYNLVAASLQTRGHTFVAPTDRALAALSKAVAPDKSTGTWPIDYDSLRSTSAGAQVYPGTMVVYLAAPTTGLPAEDAADLAQWLAFAAIGGQQPGHGNGQLPSGYVPLTKASGLSSLAEFTTRAATAVAAQRSAKPAAVFALHPFTAVGNVGQRASDNAGSSPLGHPALGTPVAPTANAGASSPARTSKSPEAPAEQPQVAPAAAVGVTPEVGAGTAGVLLPLLVVIAIAGASATLLSGAQRRLGRRRP